MTAPNGVAARARGYRAQVAHGLVPRLRRSSMSARRLANQLDSREVRMARRAVSVLGGSDARYLYMGESTLSFVSAHDDDRRKLVQMVTDDLGGPRSVAAAHGSSYHAGLYGEYVRLAAGHGARPVLIFPLCVRMHLDPWFLHPKLSYRGAVDALSALPAGAPRRRIRATIRDPRPADYEAFYRRPFPTLAGERLIGDYARPLRDPQGFGLGDDERVRLLYAYHHGGRLHPDGAGASAVTRLGQFARESGCPVVVYETPVPVEYGSSLWGASLGQLARENLDVLATAFRAGWGGDVDILRTGTELGTSAYIDPHDACEHLNETGRRWLTDVLVTAARQADAAR